MASSLITAQTPYLLPKPNTLTRRRLAAAFPLSSPQPRLSKPNFLHLPPPSYPFNSRIYASVSAAPTNPVNKSPPDILSGSTRTVTTLVALGLTASRIFAHGVVKLAVQLKEPLLRTAGPAFFAARNASPGYVSTPFTVVAAGMAKWLDLYSGVLLVRVLLSWFPNIPWDRQPLSAIRDLCDPYLNLFRNIIPPIFDTLDVSPLLAFAVLGTLASVLNSSRINA